MSFTTKNALVALMSNPSEKMRCYWVTVDGKMSGAFMVSVDKQMYHNICVVDYAFKVGDDENLEKEIFKEVFAGLAKKENMPVYFKTAMLKDETKELLHEMGAEEIVDSNEQTIWYKEKDCKVFKLQ